MGNAFAENVERGSEVEVLHLLPHLVGRIGHRRPAGKSPENVHENIQLSIAFDDLCDAPANLVEVVEVHCQRLEVGFGKICRSNVLRCADHPGPAFEKRSSHRTTEPAASSGNKHHLVFHEPSSFEEPPARRIQAELEALRYW